MLDMGFLPTIERIVAALPASRQTLFFSATIESSVRHLVDTHVPCGIRIEIGSTTKPAGQIDLRLYEVEQNQKLALLHRLLQQDEGSFLVFARTKHGAERLARRLADGGVKTAAIHGDRSQNQRNQALRGFQAGSYRVLVATDVAARGIHVDGISHVVNYDLPQVAEDFIHRVGRTGRAGARGTASTFGTCLERSTVADIERKLAIRLTRYTETGEVAEVQKPYCFAAPTAVAALCTRARKAHAAYRVGIWRCLRKEPERVWIDAGAHGAGRGPGVPAAAGGLASRCTTGGPSDSREPRPTPGAEANKRRAESSNFALKKLVTKLGCFGSQGSDLPRRTSFHD